MLRYSLGTLFLLVAVVALGCTAWLNFSELWVQVMVASVWLAISAALAVGLLGRGPSRVFATGFAVMGAAYFLLAFAMDRRDERLITQRAINWVYRWQHDAKADTTTDILKATLWVDDADLRTTDQAARLFEIRRLEAMLSKRPPPRELQDIGHCLWTLLLAAIGGVLAQVVHKTARRSKTVPWPLLSTQ